MHDDGRRYGRDVFFEHLEWAAALVDGSHPDHECPTGEVALTMEDLERARGLMDRIRRRCLHATDALLDEDAGRTVSLTTLLNVDYVGAMEEKERSRSLSVCARQYAERIGAECVGGWIKFNGRVVARSWTKYGALLVERGLIVKTAFGWRLAQ